MVSYVVVNVYEMDSAAVLSLSKTDCKPVNVGSLGVEEFSLEGTQHTAHWDPCSTEITLTNFWPFKKHSYTTLHSKDCEKLWFINLKDY